MLQTQIVLLRVKMFFILSKVESILALIFWQLVLPSKHYFRHCENLKGGYVSSAMFPSFPSLLLIF